VADGKLFDAASVAAILSFATAGPNLFSDEALMKVFYFVICLLACSTATAASLSFTQTGNATSWFLNGESENGRFNGIKVTATISPPVTFTNPHSGIVAGAPRPPGQAFTYRNRMLDRDPLDFPEGRGLVIFDAVSTPTELSFFAGSLNGAITTANETDGKLFLANVNVSDLSRFNCLFDLTVQLYLGDILIDQMDDQLLCPEPSTIAVAATLLVGFSCIRRFRPLPVSA
jgi:hypothetical protein